MDSINLDDTALGRAEAGSTVGLHRLCWGGGPVLRNRLRAGVEAVLATLFLAALLTLGAPPAQAHEPKRSAFTALELDPLVDALAEDGFDRQRVSDVLNDPRLRKLDGVVAINAMNPDSEALYAGFTTPWAVRPAHRFYRKHQAELRALERQYGVPGEFIVAILRVESHLGRDKDRYRVLEVYTTMAVENHSEAVDRHYAQLKPLHPEIEKEWLSARLMKKAAFAYKELTAVFSMFGEDLARLYEVRGSYAGAIGIPQFLPSSYLQWGVDGNGDGQVDPNNLSDAMHSVANYLRAHGWTPEAPFEDKWRAVWEYNHSEHYVRAIFDIALRLRIPPPKRMVAKS